MKNTIIIQVKSNDFKKWITKQMKNKNVKIIHNCKTKSGVTADKK